MPDDTTWIARPELQRPDWEPNKPGGCVDLGYCQIHGVTVDHANLIAAAQSIPALHETIASLKASVDALGVLQALLHEENCVLKSQVENADINLQQQKWALTEQHTKHLRAIAIEHNIPIVTTQSLVADHNIPNGYSIGFQGLAPYPTGSKGLADYQQPPYLKSPVVPLTERD